MELPKEDRSDESLDLQREGYFHSEDGFKKIWTSEVEFGQGSKYFEYFG